MQHFLFEALAQQVSITSCCWPPPRPLLLVIQRNVTERVQMELQMAELVQAQLNMLCQIFPRWVGDVELAHNRPQT